MNISEVTDVQPHLTQTQFNTQIGQGQLLLMIIQEIKEANTGDNVFLTGAAIPIDAMEDIVLNITI
jgi:hypothetical protein